KISFQFYNFIYNQPAIYEITNKLKKYEFILNIKKAETQYYAFCFWSRTPARRVRWTRLHLIEHPFMGFLLITELCQRLAPFQIHQTGEDLGVAAAKPFLGTVLHLEDLAPEGFLTQLEA